MTFFKRSCLVLCAGVLAFSLGCGNRSTGTLTGKVTLNGESLEAGQVTAHNAAGDRVGTAMISDGTYTLPDLPLGTVTLLVQTYRPGGDPVVEGLPKAPPGSPPLSPETRKKMIEGLPEKTRQQIEKLKPVPPKYGSTETSDLKAVVKAGRTTFDVEMTGKGEIPKAPLVHPGGGNPPPPHPR